MAGVVIVTDQINIMKIDDIKVCNVSLVPESDNGFQRLQLRFKTKKEKGKVVPNHINRKSSIIGYLLEKTIRNWAEQDKCYCPRRIIRYLQSGENIVRYRELDFVLKTRHSLTIAEIKTSIDGKKAISEAAKQLSTAKKNLRSVYKNIELVIISIHLAESGEQNQYDKISPDISNTSYKDVIIDNEKFKVIQLNAKDVFDYGVETGVILSPEIFYTVQQEVDLLSQKKRIQQSIKEVEDNGADTNMLQNLNEELFILRKQIDLSENGLTLIPESHESIFTNCLGNSVRIKCNDNDVPNHNCHFSSYDPTFKYLKITNWDADILIDLINSEQVYLRLKRENGLDLQNVQFKSRFLDGNVFPMYTRTPERKFYLPILPVEKPCVNPNLNEYLDVVRSSTPNTVELKQNQVMFVDNFIMLHRITKNNSNLILELIRAHH